MAFPDMHWQTHILLCLLAAIPIVLGCEISDAARDSDNVARPAVNVPLWRLSDKPQVSLGDGREHGAEYEFYQVFSGLIRRDGAIVVGNSGTNELRIFDRNGVSTRATGRVGAGPGEFRGITWMDELPGDSIIVYDPVLQRFSILSPRGDFTRTLPLQTSLEGRFRPAGLLAGPRILLAIEKLFDPREGQGRHRDKPLYVITDLTGVAIDTVGQFEGDDWLAYRTAVASQAIRLPFGPLTFLLAVGNRIASVSAESGVVAFYDTNGDSVASLSLPVVGTKISRREVREAMETLISDAPRGSHSLIRQHLTEYAGEPRVVAGVRVDRGTKDLWVKLYAPAAADTATWLLLTSDGEPIAHIRIPNALFLLDVRDRHVLVRRMDHLGIETILTYEVAK